MKETTADKDVRIAQADCTSVSCIILNILMGHTFCTRVRYAHLYRWQDPGTTCSFFRLVYNAIKLTPYNLKKMVSVS
jgi:hypothetical protein